jgi:hypothetical protein
LEARLARVAQDPPTHIRILCEADLEHKAHEDDERNFTLMHEPGVLQ